MEKNLKPRRRALGYFLLFPICILIALALSGKGGLLTAAGQKQDSQQLASPPEVAERIAASAKSFRASENLICNEVALWNAQRAFKQKQYQLANTYHSYALSVNSKNPINIRLHTKMFLKLLPDMEAQNASRVYYDLMNQTEHLCSLEPNNPKNHRLYTDVLLSRLDRIDEIPLLSYHSISLFDSVLCGLEHCQKAIDLTKKPDAKLRRMKAQLLLYWFTYAPENLLEHYVENNADNFLESHKKICAEAILKTPDEGGTISNKVKDFYAKLFIFTRFRICLAMKKYDEALKEINRLPDEPACEQVINYYTMQVYRKAKKYDKAIKFANTETDRKNTGFVYPGKFLTRAACCKFLELELAMAYLETKDYKNTFTTLLRSKDAGISALRIQLRRKLIKARMEFREGSYMGMYINYSDYLEAPGQRIFEQQDLLDYAESCKKLGKKEEAEEILKIAKYGNTPLWKLEGEKWEPKKDNVISQKPPK